MTLGGIVVVIVAAIVGQRFNRPEEEPNEHGFSIRSFIVDAFRETGNALGSPKYIAINVLVAGIEVWGMVFYLHSDFGRLGLTSRHHGQPLQSCSGSVHSQRC